MNPTGKFEIWRCQDLIPALANMSRVKLMSISSRDWALLK
jgi:hypothetical protein